MSKLDVQENLVRSHQREVEKTSMLSELKQDIELQLFIRRYQKALEGKTPFEEGVKMFFEKMITTFSLSWRQFTKRTGDVILSVIALIVSLPIMAVIAIAIKLDSKGPVILKQVRVGMRGKIFTMYKFRTMRQDAETMSGPVWAKENDPRVTRLGRFLRKTHLDETPQLFNVLKGEMSLVGPRPERPHFVSEFRKLIPHYDRRLLVKPGVTGLAQIYRRYDESLADVRKKLKYDVLYVHKMCPFLDLKVMALTVGAVMFRTGR